MSWVEGLLIAAGGTVFGGLLLRSGNPGARLHGWFRRGVATAKRVEQETTAEQNDDRLAVLREQVVALARERGITLAVSSTGRNPTTVEFSDGSSSHYFSDHVRYKFAIQHGHASPLRSYTKPPPLPVSQWDRTALDQWLQDNAD